MKAILFDLDGTVLDTREMILNSFRYAYSTVFGTDTLPPEDKLLSLIGIPLKTQMEIIAPDKSEEMFEAYIKNNREVQHTLLKGFDGMAEALAALLDKGLRLAVVTSKRHEPAVEGLELMELAHYFELVCGSDDTKEHKPKPEPLLEAARQMGLTAHECAYVGDSPFDMQAARAASMYAVGVLWGIFSKEVLLDAGAEVLLSAVSELPELFA